ncbi:MAG: hypothetical protein ABMA14_03605 [Hyphomonadaceae bacterium]
MRFAWIAAVLTAVAFSAAGCSPNEAPPPAAKAAPANATAQAVPADASIATDGQGQCYVLNRNNSGVDHWLLAGDVKTVAACLAEDGCDGRNAPGRPACSKWALGEEAPALTWPPVLTAVPPGQCYSREGREEAWSLRADFSYANCRLYDSCNGGLGTSDELTCFKWATAPDALGAQYRTTSVRPPSTATDWGTSGFPSCYWRNDVAQGWEPMEIYSEVICFRMDSCSGGSAQSGGGCYKWSKGRDAEALPWRGLKPASGKPSPLVDGLFELFGACPGEGCGLGDWRAFGPVKLLADSIAGAPVVTTVPDGEWVTVVKSIDRVAPQRGVVLKDSDEVYAGDEIWAVGYEGEGIVTVWRGGDLVSVGGSDEDVVRWDQIPEQAAPKPRAGWWVQVRRANGQNGWVLNGGGFGCIGAIDPPPECDQRNTARQ